MYRKMIAMMAALMMVMSLAACSNSQNPSKKDDSSKVQPMEIDESGSIEVGGDQAGELN